MTLIELEANGERIVRYFSADQLPREPKERLKQLFTARKQWTFTQIFPYVRCGYRLTLSSITMILRISC